METITVRNWKNEPMHSIEIEETIFGYPLKRHLIYEAVCAFRAAGRSGTHKTKNRSEVSGGTKKLWKQKHTGRARMGDNRSPIWRHGGTVFGPVPRDYSWRFPKRMRRNALKSVIAEKLRQGQLLCVDQFNLETHKTADLEAAVGKGLGVSTTALLVSLVVEEKLERAARNNPRLKVVRALGLNPVDLLNYDVVIFSEPAIKSLLEVLAR